MKYKVAVSGWAVVEVEASNPEQAQQKVAELAPGIAGELYSLEVHESVLVNDDFKQHTDFN